MKITESVTLLESTRGAYAYLIMGKEPVLVDTGFAWQRRGILRELAALGVNFRDIRHIVLTHYDLDHIGNAAALQELTGATLWASREDAPYILGEKPRPGFKKYLPYLFRTRTPRQISVFEGGAEIGGAEVIPSPGHTPGHVCLLCEGALIAGDLVKNGKNGLTPYPQGWNWDSELLLASIREINRRSFKVVCLAHGRPAAVSSLPTGQR